MIRIRVVRVVVKPVRFSPHFQKSSNRWILNVPPNLSKTGKRGRLFFPSREDALKAAHKLRERHKRLRRNVTLHSLTYDRKAYDRKRYHQKKVTLLTNGDSGTNSTNNAAPHSPRVDYILNCKSLMAKLATLRTEKEICKFLYEEMSCTREETELVLTVIRSNAE